MLIPHYWASAKVKLHKDKRRATLQRWGWSEESQEAAQVHAQARLAQAQEEFFASPSRSPFRRLERKTAYNGAEGLPIREEVLEQREEGVLTRNSYGAVCLNTPHAMFVDLDDEYLRAPSARLIRARKFFAVVLTFMLAPLLYQAGEGMGKAALLVVFTWAVLSVGLWLLSTAWSGWRYTRCGGAVGEARRRLGAHLKGSSGRWRIYQTPAGARLLALHEVFDPASHSAQLLMKKLGADPIYAKMCERQRCFRARLTPKPWRMGMERMRSGVWPVGGEALERRERWATSYDAARRSFAGCHFIEEAGLAPPLPALLAVQKLHDERAQALTKRPLA